MSPLRSYDDPAATAAYLDRSRQTWDKILAARQTITAADAQAVSTMAANYPHMSPGTVVPLAASGVAPDDPLAQHVATAEAKSNKRKRGFWGAVGDIVGGITHIPAVGAELAVRDVLNPLGGAALAVAKPVLRDTLAVAAAPLEVGMGAFRDVAAATGDIGAGLISGAATGAAVGGIFGGIGALPGALVGGAIGGVSGGIAQARGINIESQGFENPLTQSTLFQSFGSGGLGSGYMPGGTAHEAATRAQQRAAAIGGHALTPGRFIANSILEPGTAPYNLLSGAMDAAVSWELDPTQKALRGLGKWRKAEKTFLPTEKEVAAAVRAGRRAPEAAGAATRVTEEAAPAVARSTRPMEAVDDEIRRLVRETGSEDISAADYERAKARLADVRSEKAALEGGGTAPVDTGPVATITTPDVWEPPRALTKGEPGVQVERIEGKKSPYVVHRNPSGEVDGYLEITINPHTGEPGSLVVMVHPSVRRTGIGTELYRAAAEAGYDVEKVSGVGGMTEAGAAFAQGRRAKAAESAVAAERADAGLVDGARKTVIGEKVDKWLSSEKGQKSMQWFADADFESIRKQLGRNKVDIGTVRDLANAQTPEAVEAILRPQLGLEKGLELKPKVGGFGMTVSRTLESRSRLFNDLPSGKLDYANPTEAVDQFHLLLRDANIPAAEAAAHTEAFAGHLLDGSYEGRRAADALAYRSLSQAAGGKLWESGFARDTLAKIARRAADGDTSVLRSLIEEDGTRTAVKHISFDGKTQGLTAPGFLAEHMDNGIDIDRRTIRDIRSVTSRYSRLLANPKVQLGVSAADHLTNDIWKPTALLRGAWTVRVVGEEQIRMAAAGRLSLFNHPLSYLAWALDDDGKIANTFKKFGVDIGGRGTLTVEGERFAREGTSTISNADALEAELLDHGDDYANALNIKQQAEGWHDGTFVSAGHQEKYVKGAKGHVEAMAENIDKAASDPLVQMLATRPLNEVREWFLNGEGNNLRQALIKDHGAPLRSIADVDAHIEAARRNLNQIMGAVEGSSLNAADLAPAGAVGSGPRFGGEYGRHPGIGAGGPAPTAPVAPEAAGYRGMPERPGGIPGTPASRGPGEIAYEQQRAGYEQQVARQRATEEMNARYRAQGGGTTPGGGGYGGNAASQGFTPSAAPQERVLAKPGSSAVREAIATGELNGVPIRDARGRINKDFLSELHGVDDLPETIVGSSAHVPNSRWTAKRDSAVQSMFTNLMARPSAKLSRSPMFRQHYWGEAENLITEVDKASQAKMIESARSAGLPKDAVQRLVDRTALGAGDLKLHEADLLLKGRALDATQDLLYDVARKGQMSDALRIVFPFMEAQKEVMKVWAKVGTESPQVIRRAQQLLQGARGSGAFYTDPTTGEEMFTFPGSQFLTEHTLGMPIPLTGRVQGLNMFGSGIVPGVGPAVQIPTRWILPDKPQFDELNKFLDPMGATATENQGIIEQQLPGWFTKIRTAMTAPESDRTFANAVKDVWSEGVSQGRYRTDTPTDIQDGLTDAKNKARWLYFIRGLSSVAGAPTTPSPAFMAMDKDGKWQVAKVLSQDYRDMQAAAPANDQHESYEHIGPQGAQQAFLQKYGNNAAVFMQAKSYSTVPSAPSTTDFSKWARGDEAQGLKTQYGDVYALFGPQGDGFDYQAYLRNIRSGDTVSLTPQQFVEQANNRVAQMIYYNQKDRFGPTPSQAQRAWLSDLKVALRDRFPGYDIPLPGKPDQDTVKKQYIPAIEKAVNDPALKDNDVARAAKVYLEARQMAMDSAKAAGYSTFAQSKAAAPLRDWLRQIGNALGQKVPDFASMYDRVFDREMADDTVPQAAPVPA